MAGMADNDEIHVEVIPHPGLAGDLSPADLVDRFSGRVGELGRALATVAFQLRQTFETRLAEPAGSSWALGEVSLQMSINLEAEAGVIISRAKTGAAFQATLTWSRREPAAASESAAPAPAAPAPAAPAPAAPGSESGESEAGLSPG
jgi:Trypsin-co-occurring domain 1